MAGKTRYKVGPLAHSKFIIKFSNFQDFIWYFFFRFILVRVLQYLKKIFFLPQKHEKNLLSNFCFGQGMKIGGKSKLLILETFGSKTNFQWSGWVWILDCLHNLCTTIFLRRTIQIFASRLLTKIQQTVCCIFDCSDEKCCWYAPNGCLIWPCVPWYTPLQNVWHGSKSVVMFDLIKILTHPC